METYRIIIGTAVTEQIALFEERNGAHIVEKIFKQIGTLDSMPNRGRIVNHSEPKVHMLISQTYIITYQITNECVIIHDLVNTRSAYHRNQTRLRDGSKTKYL